MLGLKVNVVQAAENPVHHELLEVDLEEEVPTLVETPFWFQAFALDVLEGIEVKFLHEDGWSEWTSLYYEEDPNGRSELKFVESSRAFQLLADRDVQVEVTIMDLQQRQGQVASLNPIGLDDSDDFIASLVDSDIRLVTRNAWGADEALRTYDPDDQEDDDDDDDTSTPVNVCAPLETSYPGQYQLQSRVDYFDNYGRSLIWPQTYSQQVKKIVIHHTALSLRDINEDGAVNKRDYYLAVKAIYTYHTVSRGWGDIGYHFLVAPDGTIFEGKAGGRDVIGAHVLCQNSNTVGIAVMGNYEEERLSNAAFDGLAKITEYLADQYNINPMGKSAFRGEILPNIVTHAEVGNVTKSVIGQGSTQCPGQFLKQEMSRLRQVVDQGGSFTPLVGYEVASLDVPRTVQPLQEFSVTGQLLNSGQQMWTSLQVYDGRELLYENDSLLASPGQSTSFSFPVQALFDAGRKQNLLTIMVNGQRMKNTVAVNYSVERPEYRYELVQFSGGDKPLLVGEQRTVQATFKNTSNFPWLSSGVNRVQLQELVMRGGRSTINPRGTTVFLSQDVPIGGEWKVSFDLPLQRTTGEFNWGMAVVLGRDQELRGEAIQVSLEVEQPRFVAEITPTNPRTLLKRGFEEDVSMSLFNRGNFDWEPGMIWVAFNGQERMMVQQTVPQGTSVNFTVPVRSGYRDRAAEITGIVGVDRLPSYLVGQRLRENQARFSEVLRLTGRGELNAEFVSQSIDQLTPMVQDQQILVSVKNTGTVPWYNDGAEILHLELLDEPHFYHRSWANRRRVTTLQQDEVLPGEVGTFSFQLRVGREQRRTVSDRFGLYVGDQLLRLRGDIKVSLEGAMPEVRERTTTRTSEPVEDSSDQEVEESSEQSSLQIPPMRVWLTEIDQSEVAISSPGGFIVWDSKSTKVKPQNGEQQVLISEADVRDGTIYRLRVQEAPYLEFKNWDRIRAFGNNLNDNRFRGVIEVRWDQEDQKLIAINELPLEDYMKGIAEVPETDDQPQEKRKVIAVLSRSYALHYLISEYQKFPGKPYNAADSPAIFQKYNGYGFELRSPKWQAALEETQNEVVLVDSPELSFPEAVLRAAYFSCTDGNRTKSWDEVWSDNQYFQRFGEVFQSVSDPLGDDPGREGITACGHQVGLSGYGATQKAAQGENYQDIIEYYYQNVIVADQLSR